MPWWNYRVMNIFHFSFTYSQWSNAIEIVEMKCTCICYICRVWNELRINVIWQGNLYRLKILCQFYVYAWYLVGFCRASVSKNKISYQLVSIESSNTAWKLLILEFRSLMIIKIFLAGNCEMGFHSIMFKHKLTTTSPHILSNPLWKSKVIKMRIYSWVAFNISSLLQS